MSELINENGSSEHNRCRLLTTVSALAIVSAACLGSAEADNDSGRPVLWIELGGQLETTSELQKQFAPRFLTDPAPLPPAPYVGTLGTTNTATGIPWDLPLPNIFDPVHPLDLQRPPKYSFGGEGKISLQPHGTDWVFSASVRYGRATGHKSNQRVVPVRGYLPNDKYWESLGLFSDTRTDYSESHLVLDFQAGKDVGLGMLGHETKSRVNFGVRFAQFVDHSGVRVDADPNIRAYKTPGTKYEYFFRFQTYDLRASTSRSFHGIGPSLSWSNSTPLVGEPDGMELALDWGVNGSVLFGRQKADVSHHTSHHDNMMIFAGGNNIKRFQQYYNFNATERSKRVIIPNVGAMAGLSANFPQAKISIGYRADFFFGAMDMGIDTRQTQTMSFHGPYATLSIGLGG